MKKEKRSHGVQLLIRAVVKDPDGKILSDTGQKPSKSFVIQFLEFIGAMMDRVATINATDTSGAERVMLTGAQQAQRHMRANVGINVSLYGIQVGTGDTAETNTDFRLDVQLTEGVGAGNITHGAMVIETTAVVGANVDLELKRDFPNNTGSTITVKEAGIVVAYTLAPGPYYHCIIRDVLPESVDVLDKCSLTVFYTLRTTV